MTVNVITFAYTFESLSLHKQILPCKYSSLFIFPGWFQHLPNEERCQIWDPRVTLLIVMGSVGQESEQCLSSFSVSVIETVTIFEEEGGVISA